MSGVSIVGTLLRAHDALLELVPFERIKAGSLPANAPLPSILIRSVSRVERQPLKRGEWVRVTERVAVTVRASAYRDQGVIIRLITSGCAGQVGNVGGGTRVSILSAGRGPDVKGPGDSFEQTQDFRVSFEEPA